MTTKSTILLAIVYLIMPYLSFSQSYYNQTNEFIRANGVWTFYDSLGLNFNDPNNFLFTSNVWGQWGAEGSASVADPVTGELLFYSNGGSVWNKNHQLMPNGGGILGNGTNDEYSAMQGVCIVEKVGDPGKFYLFSLEGHAVINNNPPLARRLYYSVIDMALDGGMGDVLSGMKNILLDSAFLGEAMIAVPGDNCDDIWLITHALDSAIFKAYHITAAGVQHTPVLSYTGSQIQGEVNFLMFGSIPVQSKAYYQSCMAVSPDRKKIAINVHGAEEMNIINTKLSSTGRTAGTLVCNFDPGTGEVSDAILIDTVGGDGLAFSPDNSKLYTFSIPRIDRAPAINQFDISIFDSTSIVSSRFVLQSFPMPTVMDHINGQVDAIRKLRLYNDTIFVSNRINSSIDRINNPNLTGMLANYEPNAISLPSASARSLIDLPNDVVLAGTRDTLARLIFDTVICNTQLTLGPSVSGYNMGNYQWNDNTSDSFLTVNQSGVYWVRYNDWCHYWIDSFIVEIDPMAPPIITINIDTLSTLATYQSYQWLLGGEIIAGATQRSYKVLENGNYQVIVSNDQGCVDTSEVYEVTNVNIKEPGYISGRIYIYPNPANEAVFVQAPAPVKLSLSSLNGTVLKQEIEANALSMDELPAGMYLLRVSDRYGRLLKVEKIIKAKK